MIFVDTGAWFAVAVRNDPDHRGAMAWLQRNREPLITTDYVLSETATLLRTRDKTALREEAAILERVTRRDLQEALEVFRTYRDHLFSFVDCTSFVVMLRLGIKTAFAFDHHFDEYPGIGKVPSEG